MGAKKQPSYRIVVQDSRAARDGKFIETIGNYNPRTDPPTVDIDSERVLYWLSVGGQPSEAVRRILDKMGVLTQVAAARPGQPGAAAATPQPLTLEPEELPAAEEDEDFEVDLFEEAEESDETEEEWESDMETSDEMEDDLDEDDWETDVEDTDDDTDDEPMEDDE
jgi:small subunit ribosomal protein S16